VVTYSAGAFDACGIASFDCTPQSGTTFPCGTTTVTCRAVDGAGNPNSCSFTITVNCNRPNTPPNCVARLAPDACGLQFVNDGRTYALSLDGTSTCVILDASGSSDAEHDPLTFTWREGTNIVGVGAVVTNCLSLGCHTLTLTVSDGQDSCTTTLSLCAISTCEAVEQCVALVDNANLGRKNKRPLIASLKAACASFDRGSFDSGVGQLGAFLNKVRAQVSRDYPNEARAFTDCVQNILDAVNCAVVLRENHVGKP